MRVLFFLGLILLAAVTIFALSNSAPVTVRFLMWRQPTSLAVAMIGAAVTGAVIVYLASLAAQQGLKARLRASESRLADLERQRPPAVAPTSTPPASTPPARSV